MGQEEVIRVLERNKKPMTRTQIAKEMNDNPIKVSRCLSVLIKFNEVKYIEIDRYEARKLCGAKRRTKLYYI